MDRLSPTTHEVYATKACDAIHIFILVLLCPLFAFCSKLNFTFYGCKMVTYFSQMHAVNMQRMRVYFWKPWIKWEWLGDEEPSFYTQVSSNSLFYSAIQYNTPYFSFYVLFLLLTLSTLDTLPSFMLESSYVLVPNQLKLV